MADNFVQCGEIMDWTNPGAGKLSGDVVVIGAGLIGVCLVDIANGQTGSVQIADGVFRVPKVPGAVIGQGEFVVWDASAGAFDDALAVPATGDVSGNVWAFRAAGDGVTTVEIKLTGLPGTVA